MVISSLSMLTTDQTQESNTNTLLDTTADCLRFVTEFFEVISQSGPHIYHSALQLVPQSSTVQKLYSHLLGSPAATVVTGIPTSWDSCTASAGAKGRVSHAAWSLCGQFIAAASSTIEIRDSNTLETVSVLKPPHHVSYWKPRFVTFSSDGCLLACSYFR